MDNFTTVFLFTDKANELIDSASGDLTCNTYGMCFGLFLLFALWVARKEEGVKIRAVLVAGWLVINVLGYISANQSKLAYEQKYKQLLHIYNARQYKIAEGTIHIIELAEERKHGDFISVGDTEFEIGHFSNQFGGFGYRDTIAYNGVLKEGVYARIYYYTDGLILRIDIKN